MVFGGFNEIPLKFQKLSFLTIFGFALEKFSQVFPSLTQDAFLRGAS